MTRQLVLMVSVVFVAFVGCSKKTTGGGGTPGPENNCPAACATGQHCDTSAGVCVCDNPCTTAGAICDPAGSNQLGVCVQDPATSCFSVTGLAACPGFAQVCTVGSTACACPATPACTGSETRCKPDNTGTEVCGVDAFGCQGWAPAATCTTHQTCDPTAGPGSTPACKCNDVCVSAGANPSLQCGADTAQYQRCTADANSCRFWADVNCPGGQLCDSDKASAGTMPACSCPATPVCTVNEFHCNSTTGNPERCIMGGGGCPMWNEIDRCDQRSQECVATGSTNAACQCKAVSADCNGTTRNERFCVADGGTQFQRCREASGCFYFEAVESCASTLQTCEVTGPGNVGDCQCTLETCTPGTQPSCSSDVLTTCTADLSGCGVSNSTNCQTYGQACVTDPAPPHCTCPGPSAGSLYVDAVNGNDTFGTGASAPPGCAFRTITKGLATAVASDSVIARPGIYNQASGETFPIALKDGVTLTTDATPPDAATYVIDGSNNITVNPIGQVAATVVYLVAGSPVLNNFTLDGGGGGNRFVCNAGTPALTNVVAQNADTGISVLAACSATLSGVNTTNNVTNGLRIATSSGTTTITNSKSDGDDTGLRVEDGIVSVSGLEVANSQNRGVYLRPANVGFGTPISQSIVFTATGLKVHDAGGEGIRLREPNGGGTQPFGAITITSSEVYLNAGRGIEVNDSSPTFTGMIIHDNDDEGILVDQAFANPIQVTISASSIYSNAQQSNVSAVNLMSGTLTITGAQGAPTTVTNNLGAGIGAGGGTLTVDGVTVNGNQAGGVIVDNAATGQTAVVQLKNLVVSNNANGPGIGVMEFDGTPDVSITGCDIFGNGGSYDVDGQGTMVDVGGVLAATGSDNTVTAFTGNKVHSNSFNGIDVLFGAQDLGPAACGADSNQFYCYGTNRGVSASNGGTATADFNQWATATPAQGTDYTTGVTVNNSCSAVVATCP